MPVPSARDQRREGSPGCAGRGEVRVRPRESITRALTGKRAAASLKEPGLDTRLGALGSVRVSPHLREQVGLHAHRAVPARGGDAGEQRLCARDQQEHGRNAWPALHCRSVRKDALAPHRAVSDGSRRREGRNSRNPHCNEIPALSNRVICSLFKGKKSSFSVVGLYCRWKRFSPSPLPCAVCLRHCPLAAVR